MANICENKFYASSDNRENLDAILKYFEDCKKFAYNYDDALEEIYIDFDSKWTFPESEMNDLYDLIPDKSDIFMRCLSVEYGNNYHALWKCENENGWIEV